MTTKGTARAVSITVSIRIVDDQIIN